MAVNRIIGIEMMPKHSRMSEALPSKSCRSLFGGSFLLTAVLTLPRFCYYIPEARVRKVELASTHLMPECSKGPKQRASRS